MRNGVVGIEKKGGEEFVIKLSAHIVNVFEWGDEYMGI